MKLIHYHSIMDALQIGVIKIGNRALLGFEKNAFKFVGQFMFINFAFYTDNTDPFNKVM